MVVVYCHLLKVVLDGVSKAYSQGYGVAPVIAVAGLWQRVWPGECFGLLGVNGEEKSRVLCAPWQSCC